MSLIDRISDFRYLIKKEKVQGMRVDGMIYASSRLMDHINQEETFKQVVNVAFLPGIQRYSIGMPDIHWGYGFPIGGVAALDAGDGIVSPGGVGSDINCGVRVILTPLTVDEIKNKKEKIIEWLFFKVPAGVGEEGPISLTQPELEKVVKEGVPWAIAQGYGFEEDLDSIEDQGCLKGASLAHVSKTAVKRGLPQLGTLGSGNHFLEIQKVSEIYEPETAERFGLFKDQVMVMIHTGSRGFGYQVCEDYLQSLQSVQQKYGFRLPDRQLASAPIHSREGKEYISAMNAAANYAWVNRQVITHYVRLGFQELFRTEPRGLKVLYDVAHNIAKFENHTVEGRTRSLLVHRKGATRAFARGASGLSSRFRETGQPVLIPGDMGRASYILTGTETAMNDTFGTVCHGAGRMMSRHQARKKADRETLYRELGDKGIILKAKSWSSVAEEIPEAYKDIDEIVNVVVQTGLAKKVAKLTPLAVMKG
ncbi:MAG: RtcB family protein [bacterium]|nr:RtcB family protein [bacterium]